VRLSLPLLKLRPRKDLVETLLVSDMYRLYLVLLGLVMIMYCRLTLINVSAAQMCFLCCGSCEYVLDSVIVQFLLYFVCRYLHTSVQTSMSQVDFDL
jgi:hypothetical protein